MKRTFLAVATFALSLGAFADTWGDAEAWVYTPKYSNYIAEEYVSWIATDSKGNKANIYYKNNSDGTIDEASLQNAMSELRLSVGSVFQNMAYLAQNLVSVNATLVTMDKELEDLDAKLDNIFAQVFKNLKELKTEKQSPDGSGTITETATIIEKTENHFVTVSNGKAALAVDNKTICTVGSGSDKMYQLKNYAGANGFIPFATRYEGLIWNQPMTWFDPVTLDCDVNSLKIPSVSGSKYGVHLAGWYDTTGHTCSETIADQLEAGENTHYVLTKNRSNGELHYTDVGKMAAGGYAIQFVGTDGTPVVLGAPSAKTNTVTFASAADSNVSVTIGGSSSAVTVTIGVYYK